jgi:hypothetical protein
MLGCFRWGFVFLNFMFSYFNFNVGVVMIQTAPPFPEKVAQFGKICYSVTTIYPFCATHFG